MLSICEQGNYAKKHCPWTGFKDVPASASMPFSRFPTHEAGFATLPTVAMVIPNLIHDMHSLPKTTLTLPHSQIGDFCNIQEEVYAGDLWLKDRLDGYVQWAKRHNSLLIVTWDEDSAVYTYPTKASQKIDTEPPQNHVATILVGAMVKPGATSDRPYNHYDLLRTIEDIYGLPLMGGSKRAKAITGIWK